MAVDGPEIHADIQRLGRRVAADDHVGNFALPDDLAIHRELHRATGCFHELPERLLLVLQHDFHVAARQLIAGGYLVDVLPEEVVVVVHLAILDEQRVTARGSTRRCDHPFAAIPGNCDVRGDLV